MEKSAEKYLKTEGMQRRCRACLSDTAEYFLPLQSNCCSSNIMLDMTIAQLLTASAKVEFAENDTFSQFVCNECVEMAEMSYVFKMMCKTSEVVFHRYYKDKLENHCEDASNNSELTSPLNIINEDNTTMIEVHENWHSCLVCGKIFSLHSNLVEHRKKHLLQMKCLRCPHLGLFKCMKNLFDHHRRCHSYRVSAGLVQNSRRTCNHCGKLFKFRKNMLKHKSSKHVVEEGGLNLMVRNLKEVRGKIDPNALKEADPSHWCHDSCFSSEDETSEESKSSNILEQKREPVCKNSVAQSAQDSCIYCLKPVEDLSFHLETCQSSETAIQNLLTSQPNCNVLGSIKDSQDTKKSIRKYVSPYSLNSDEELPTVLSLGEPENLVKDSVFADNLLHHVVFPNMPPDKITLMAKQDFLICKFGLQFLKKLGVPNGIKPCIMHMRELARLVKHLISLNPALKGLHEALQPSHLDMVMAYIQQWARVHHVVSTEKAVIYLERTYKLLADCCDIAIKTTLEQNSETVEEISGKFVKFKELLQERYQKGIVMQKAEKIPIPIAKKKSNLWSKSTNREMDINKTCHSHVGSELNFGTSDENNSSANQSEHVNVNHVKSLKILNTDFHESLKNSEVDMELPSGTSYKDSENESNNDLNDNCRNSCSIDLNASHRNSNSNHNSNINVTESEKQLTTDKDYSNFMPDPKSSIVLKSIITATEPSLLVLKHEPPSFHTMKSSFLPEKTGDDISPGSPTISSNEDSCESDTKCLIKRLKLDDESSFNHNIEQLMLKSQPVIINKICITADPLGGYEPKNRNQPVVGKQKKPYVKWTEEQKKATIKYFMLHIKQRRVPRQSEVALFRRKVGDLLFNKTWVQIKSFIQHVYRSQNYTEYMR